MTIVASGAISLAAIQAEFGGPATNMVLQSYYAGGSYVAAGTLNGVGVAIPSSGAIKLQDFYGASSVTFPINGANPSVYSQGAAGGNSSGSIYLNNDGTITHNGVGTIIRNQYSGPASWISPTSSGIGSGYSLIVDSVASSITGGTPSGPALSTWITIGAGGISFLYSNNGNRGPDYEWNCRIKNNTSGAVVATFQIAISLENT